ncbi:MAG: tetratricopeptide repeat protein [Gemmatimonadaceae bacterium]
MANVAALRKKAADFEQKKQLDKAIAAYREILDVYDAGGEDNIDVGLYNRVGDLLVRQGYTPDAVTLYERAVDLYAEGGFFNNAIALCNKILRTSPGRATVYYKLGKISAAKGFNGDAKSNFLEYADRMQKAGQMEEAFRALKEFADLCPDQDDIRLMLAEQLTKADRKKEALEQLQLLHARYTSAGREAEAQATFVRMKVLDPNAEVKAAGSGKSAKADDLVFIDLDAPTPRAGRITRGISTKIEIAPPPPPPPPPPPSAPPPPPVAKAPPPEVLPEVLPEVVPEVVPEARVPDIVPDIMPEALPEALVPDIMPEAIDPSPPAGRHSGAILGLESTSLGDPEIIEAAPLAVSAFAEIDLTAIPEAPSGPHHSARGLALPGDLPLINLDGTPIAGTARVSAQRSAPPADVELPILDLDELPDPRKSAEMLAKESDALIELVADAPDTPTAFSILPDEQIEELPPPVRRTTSVLANSVGMLRVRLEEEPTNWALHREYAEALLDDGDREGGLKELEAALVGFEKGGDLEGARSIADEIIRLNPGSVRYHQKRVEYAFRSNDKPRLADAYIALADALFRDGQAEKAKQVYHRVLELSPADARASAAIESFGTPVIPTQVQPAPRPSVRPARVVTPTKGGRRYTASFEAPMVPAPVPAPPPPAGGDDDFVSLGDWLRDQEAPKSTRMVVDEEAPTGDEQADFADMLKKFKQGVADNVDAEDHESHYDLGVAYKEMGLVDEAIAEFQKALRGHQNRVRTYEALGHCFLEKKQLPVAATILHRALSEPGARDEQLVGVLYLLGYVNESLGKPTDAKTYYERVFGVDIQFRDVGERLNAVDKALAK